MDFYEVFTKWSILGNQASYAYRDLEGKEPASLSRTEYVWEERKYLPVESHCFKGACYSVLSGLPIFAKRLDCYIPDIYELVYGESGQPFLQELWDLGCGKYLLENVEYVTEVPKEALATRPEAKFIKVSFNLDVIPAHIGMLILNFYRMIQEFPQILRMYYWLKEKHPKTHPSHNLFAAFALLHPDEQGHSGRNSNHMAVPATGLKVKETLEEIFLKVEALNLPPWNQDTHFRRVQLLNDNWEGVGDSPSHEYSTRSYNSIIKKVKHAKPV